MTNNEAIELAIMSLQHNMSEILLLQGNNVYTYPMLNRFNDTIEKLREMQNETDPKVGILGALETLKSVAWDWCYAHDFMSGYNPDYYERIQRIRKSIDILGGYKPHKASMGEVGHNE